MKTTLLQRIRDTFCFFTDRQWQGCLDCAEAGDVVIISPIATLWRKRCPRCGSKRLAWFCLADIDEPEGAPTPDDDNTPMSET